MAALFLLGPALGIRYSAPQALAVVLGLAVSVAGTYALALACAAVVLRAARYRNLASNLVHAVMALICGVNVPVGFWPIPIQWFAQIFPVTHGLGAARSALAAEGGHVITAAVPHLATAAVISLAWFIIAVLLLEHFASSARRSGTIDLDE
jgi:ABC-2 type transport system permease protein